MFKLDRNSFSTSKISDNITESDKYKNYSTSEKHQVFSYLQSVSYNFPLNQYPKMDKTYFEIRKLNGQYI